MSKTFFLSHTHPQNIAPFFLFDLDFLTFWISPLKRFVKCQKLFSFFSHTSTIWLPFFFEFEFDSFGCLNFSKKICQMSKTFFLSRTHPQYGSPFFFEFDVSFEILFSSLVLVLCGMTGLCAAGLFTSSSVGRSLLLIFRNPVYGSGLMSVLFVCLKRSSFFVCVHLCVVFLMLSISLSGSTLCFWLSSYSSPAL
jgi:hypothetical protein